MPNPTLEQIRADYRLLDTEEFEVPANCRLVSHEQFTTIHGVEVEHVRPSRLCNLFRKHGFLYSFFYSLQLLRAVDRNTVLIVNGGSTIWLIIAYLNKYLFGGKRRLCLWDVFVEYKLGKDRRLKFFPFITMTSARKEAIARTALNQYEISILWSRKQVGTHAACYRLPEEKFMFLPFKANHSKTVPYEIPIDNFIFSGGNGKRDYRCLVEAVRDTGIPVIISATDPEVRKTIDKVANVMVLGAPEPAFGQLQAASRFCVFPMIYSGLKGGGEANFCNGMWHGKPVIASCSIAAEDYIIDGETGFVVPSGDSEALKKRILELWNDPNRVREMGKKAHEHVANNFTHELFIRRLLRAAIVVWENGDHSNKTK